MEVLETRGAKYVANSLFNTGHVGLCIADIIRSVHLGSKYGLIGASLDYGSNHNHKPTIWTLFGATCHKEYADLV